MEQLVVKTPKLLVIEVPIFVEHMLHASYCVKYNIKFYPQNEPTR